MSENRAPLILFGIGLLIIGWLFYLVNIKNSQTKTAHTIQTHTSADPAKTTDTKGSSDSPVAAEEVSNKDRYEPKAYKEVFKETPEIKTTVERVSEAEKIASLKEKSDAIIEKANARIKEKNLTAAGTPPSAKKLEALEKKAEALEKKIK